MNKLKENIRIDTFVNKIKITELILIVKITTNVSKIVFGTNSS